MLKIKVARTPQATSIVFIPANESIKSGSGRSRIKITLTASGGLSQPLMKQFHHWLTQQHFFFFAQSSNATNLLNVILGVSTFF